MDDEDEDRNGKRKRPPAWFMLAVLTGMAGAGSALAVIFAYG